MFTCYMIAHFHIHEISIFYIILLSHPHDAGLPFDCALCQIESHAFSLISNFYPNHPGLPFASALCQIESGVRTSVLPR